MQKRSKKLWLWSSLGAVLLTQLPTSRIVSLAGAQDRCATVLEQAYELYDVGEYGRVIASLKPCLPVGIETEQKLRACKLLALASLAIDDTVEAEKAVGWMLDQDPKYKPDPSQEQIEFIRLVERAKQQRLTQAKKSGRKWLWIGGGGLVAAGVAAVLISSGGGVERLPDPPGLP